MEANDSKEIYFFSLAEVSARIEGNFRNSVLRKTVERPLGTPLVEDRGSSPGTLPMEVPLEPTSAVERKSTRKTPYDTQARKWYNGFESEVKGK